jgi:hypothetical protein
VSEQSGDASGRDRAFSLDELVRELVTVDCDI